MITVKRGDRHPHIDATLLNPDGTAVDLSGASVKFLMRSVLGGVLKVNASATVVDAAAGQVSYVWGATDTDTAGDYRAEFEVTFGDGTKLTVPNDSYLPVTVLEDLG